jgi:anaphase-promoting complex subunit 5
MGLPSQALKLIDQSLLLILSHGGNYDQGRALLLFAKCKVAAVTGQPAEVRKKVFTEAIHMLNKAKISFQKVESYCRVKDILYLQVNIFFRIVLKSYNCTFTILPLSFNIGYFEVWESGLRPVLICEI